MTHPSVRVASHIRKDTTKVKAGVLVSYSGTTAQVQIDGSTLNLLMLDSVSSTIALGTTVVCQVHGMTGYVIGSLATVSRSNSGTWTGSFYAPPVPRPNNQSVNYTLNAPVNIGVYESLYGTLMTSATKPVQSNSYYVTTALGSGNAAVKSGWFYGSNAFTQFSGKTIQSVEIYMSGLTDGSNTYPLNVYYHTFATRPGGYTGFTLSGTPQSISTSGWVTLNASFITALSSNLTGFGLAIAGTPTAVLSGSSPFGTLRIGWSN